MSDGPLWQMKVLCLIAGCCTKFMTGSIFVFNVYQGAIKDMFNYTQTAVESFSSMALLGLNMGFLPGIICEKIGPRWTSSLGVTMAFIGHFLIWSTTKSVRFYSRRSWLMTMYFFLLGLGYAFLHIVPTITNGLNFEKKHSGKVMGILNSMFGASQYVFPLIYYFLFTDGDITDRRNQDFPGFFIMLTIVYVVVGVVCLPFLRNLTTEHESYTALEETTDINKTKQNHEVGKLPKTSTDSSVKTNPKYKLYESFKHVLTVPSILYDIDYQLILWMFSIGSCIGWVYLNNITVISRSVHLDHYNDRLTLIIPITSCVGSTLIGVASDCFRNYIPRTTLLFLACIVICVSQILVAIFANVLAFLIISTLCVGLSSALFWSITPSILRETFHAGNFGRNWGIATFLASILNIGAQSIFGFLYDSQKDDPGDIDCFGMKCIRSGIILLILLSGISISFSLFKLIKAQSVSCNVFT